MKTYKNLFNSFISDENIKQSIKDASKGKKKKKRKDVRKVIAAYESDLKGTIEYFREYAIHYVNDNHAPIEIYDGISRKKRTIIVPTFRELVVQHMIVNVLKPLFLQGIYERAYGSVPGRGAHDGKKIIEKWIRKDPRNCKYCLKLDISKYFESIPHDVLKAKLSRELKDDRLLEIMFTLIDSTDKGLPLGFYTSQWLSMWYLKGLDHCIKEQCYSPHYMRYMDDIVIFGANKRKLWKTYHCLEKYLQDLGLRFNNRSQLFKFDYQRCGKEYGRDLDFMGFRFYRNKTTLRRNIYYKMCRKAKRVSRKDKPSIYELRQMMSYLGYIKDTDVYNAYCKYIKPYFSFQKSKRRISNYDRRGDTLWI